ncbi:hypothetical protein GN244_ATG05303 [Phytophthora infestans]|uniref:Uncharacterized protein n=1 Tax=Phytophthora infestans TaxID=4787 RepID=A0A833W4X1_PHYIN|nr:hypothetical protein GN244_ATG05303 [Phytophthora infestans]
MYVAAFDFPQALQVFVEPFFWRQLGAANETIRPLSNVSYKLQRDKLSRESPSLRFSERLCGYGIYYYGRYGGTTTERDIERLEADLNAWYRGVFVISTAAQFRGDVRQFWRFFGDIKAHAKLAHGNNPLNRSKYCNGYLSLLAATPTARKFSLIRHAIQQLTKVVNKVKELVELKRIITASEREHV